MHALLIDPAKKTIEQIELEGSLDAIRAAIGHATIECDEIDDCNDRLFFDEECFIRQQPHPGRFKLDSLPPVAGLGLVVGGGPDEASLTSPELSLDDIKGRVEFS